MYMLSALTNLSSPPTEQLLRTVTSWPIFLLFIIKKLVRNLLEDHIYQKRSYKLADLTPLDFSYKRRYTNHPVKYYKMLTILK